MKVIACQKNAVHKEAKRHGATHWLCILDPSDRPPFISPRLQQLNKLHLRFEDVLEETDPLAPTRDDVAKILEWGETIPDDATVIVNCMAGVSRSTAAALALMVQKDGDIEGAGEQLIEQRPEACPNPLITQFADEHLGLGGKLHEKGEEIANEKMERIIAGLR